MDNEVRSQPKPLISRGKLATRGVSSPIDNGGQMSMGLFAEELWQRDKSHPHFERNDATQRLAEALL
jgi:hypothetical protein